MVIDISRIDQKGLDTAPFDNDLYDSFDIDNLPEVKSYIQPLYFGDVEFDHLSSEWSGYDTSNFSNVLTVVIPEIIQPSLSEFDIDTFENLVSDIKSKTLNLSNIAGFDTGILDNLF